MAVKRMRTRTTGVQGNSYCREKEAATSSPVSIGVAVEKRGRQHLNLQPRLAIGSILPLLEKKKVAGPLVGRKEGRELA